MHAISQNKLSHNTQSPCYCGSLCHKTNGYANGWDCWDRSSNTILCWRTGSWSLYIYSVCILVCIKKRQYEWKDLNERQQIDKIQSLLLFIVKEIFVTSHYLGGGGHLFLCIRWLKIDHMINSNFIFFSSAIY